MSGYGNRGTWGYEAPPMEFPHVDSKYLAQAPPRCPRAGCGGLWREVEEGFVCRSCGRRWRAGDCLLKMVGKALAHMDREMAVRMDNPAPPKRGR
jgi:hypothetical protein